MRKKIGELLIEMKALDAAGLARALAEQLGLECVLNLEEEDLDPDVLRLVPRTYMKSHELLPLRQATGGITVLTSDPLRFEPLAHLETLMNVAVRPVLATPQVIQEGILSFDQMRDSAESSACASSSSLGLRPMTTIASGETSSRRSSMSTSPACASQARMRDPV